LMMDAILPPIFPPAPMTIAFTIAPSLFILWPLSFSLALSL
jgi:hypothetical protein